MSLMQLVGEWDQELLNDVEKLRKIVQQLFHKNHAMLSDLRNELASSANDVVEKIEAKEYDGIEGYSELIVQHMVATAACIMISQMFLDCVREKKAKDAEAASYAETEDDKFDAFDQL